MSYTKKKGQKGAKTQKPTTAPYREPTQSTERERTTIPSLMISFTMPQIRTSSNRERERESSFCYMVHIRPFVHIMINELHNFAKINSIEH